MESLETMSQQQASKREGGRCLTTSSAGVSNDGFDNEMNDLILIVDDVLVSNNRRQVA